MRSIVETGKQEYIINKSKFYSYAYPIFDDGDARAIVDRLSSEYADATHICFAYTIDSPCVERCSDDGEPAGTAGKPMLELIKKKDLHNVLLVVVRYFGGVKLGAGGLVRAYTTSGKLALDNADVVEYELLPKLRITTSYDNFSRVCAMLESRCRIVSRDYGVPCVECVGDIEDIMQSLGAVEIEKMGSEYVCHK